MSAVQALRCDNLIVVKPNPSNPWTTGIVDRIECPAVSRATTTPAALGTVAERDGWVTRPDGSHLCPSCAAATKGAAA